MPDPRSPERDRLASPAYIKGWRSRIKCGMTPFLDSIILQASILRIKRTLQGAYARLKVLFSLNLENLSHKKASEKHSPEAGNISDNRIEF